MLLRPSLRRLPPIPVRRVYPLSCLELPRSDYRNPCPGSFCRSVQVDLLQSIRRTSSYSPISPPFSNTLVKFVTLLVIIITILTDPFKGTKPPLEHDFFQIDLRLVQDKFFNFSSVSSEKGNLTGPHQPLKCDRQLDKMKCEYNNFFKFLFLKF